MTRVLQQEASEFIAGIIEDDPDIAVSELVQETASAFCIPMWLLDKDHWIWEAAVEALADAAESGVLQ